MNIYIFLMAFPISLPLFILLLNKIDGRGTEPSGLMIAILSSLLVSIGIAGVV